MSEWISVDERLPEEGQRVLLYWAESKHHEDGSFYCDIDSGETCHVLFDGESLNVQPTHWMPLPEPPK